MVRPSYNSGFTVIEVVLFLAISGLMILGMFVGISGSIDRQRYDDATESFQDFLQGQYNLVDNVRNNRHATTIASCDGASRGTSDCTIVGRLVTTENGRDFVSEPIFATGTNYDTSHDEAALLDSLQLKTGPEDTASDNDDYTLAWQTQLYTNKTNRDGSRAAQLLIVRIPTSGIVRTYFRPSTSGALAAMWQSPSPSKISLCVEPHGLITSNPTGVRILASAINTSSVQFITAGDGAC